VKCQISLTIDAQRVADVQYGMRDFLDEETSDEEWRGDRDIGDSGYAW
jgi:hypothetical protein